MTSDDDKDSKHKLQDCDPISSKVPVPRSHLDNESVDLGNYVKEHLHASDVIDIEKNSPEGDHDSERPVANYLFANNEGEEPVEEIKSSSADHYEQQERQVFERKVCDDGPDIAVIDGFKHGQSGAYERLSKGKSKRHFDDKNPDERTHNRKRSKSKNSSQQVSGAISSIFGESPYNSSPDRPLQGPDKGPVDLMDNRTTRDDINDADLQTGSNQVISARLVSDSHQPGQRSSEAHAWTEAPSGEKKATKHNSLDRSVKYSGRSLQTTEHLQIQKGYNAKGQSEDSLVNERQPFKFSAGGVGDKHALVIESHNRKSGMMGKVNYRGYSSKDNNTSTADRSQLINGCSGVLRREHSDLELGEFREPVLEEIPGSKKQIERKSSFKHLENKTMESEYWNLDSSRGKKSNKINADSGKLSPTNAEVVVTDIADGPYKRKAQENYVDDLTKLDPRSTQPLDTHHQSWEDHTDIGSQHNTVPEISGKSRFAEVGMGRGACLEAYGDTSRKKSVNSTEQQHDPIRGVGLGPRVTKQSKKNKPNVIGVSNGRWIDDFTGSDNGRQKKKVSYSDEDISPYTKYKKEEPDLKGSIKDISQYKEYMKEYQEKYENYCSLNKILESYREEFSKLGKDLEAHKGRDMKRYHDILEQMRSSFCQYGEKHKRLKKIFIVLYEELKHLKQRIKDYAAPYKKD